jgi:hypothetical protein
LAQKSTNSGIDREQRYEPLSDGKRALGLRVVGMADDKDPQQNRQDKIDLKEPK